MLLSSTTALGRDWTWIAGKHANISRYLIMSNVLFPYILLIFLVNFVKYFQIKFFHIAPLSTKKVSIINQLIDFRQYPALVT